MSSDLSNLRAVARERYLSRRRKLRCHLRPSRLLQCACWRRQIGTLYQSGSYPLSSVVLVLFSSFFFMGMTTSGCHFCKDRLMIGYNCENQSRSLRQLSNSFCRVRVAQDQLHRAPSLSVLELNSTSTLHKVHVASMYMDNLHSTFYSEWLQFPLIFITGLNKIRHSEMRLTPPVR